MINNPTYGPSSSNLNAFHVSDQHDVVELRHSAVSQSTIDVLSNHGEENDKDTTDGEKNENVFAIKKTLAQGMMDVALITANANQLRYIIEFNSNSKTYHFAFTMILISILLQVIVGISLIWMGKKDYHGHIDDHHHHAAICNKFVLIGVFFITIINVFIATFPITGHNVQ